MKPASWYKTQADLQDIESLIWANMKLDRPWHSGVDVTHLNINQETCDALSKRGYIVDKSPSCTFIRWR